MESGIGDVGKTVYGGSAHSWRIGVAVAAMLLALSACSSTTSNFIPRNDGGFKYNDFRGSPFDQISVPNPAINQIQCPPPSRPTCGG
jgi:hypothetical protein